MLARSCSRSRYRSRRALPVRRPCRLRLRPVVARCWPGMLHTGFQPAAADQYLRGGGARRGCPERPQPGRSTRRGRKTWPAPSPVRTETLSIVTNAVSAGQLTRADFMLRDKAPAGRRHRAHGPRRGRCTWPRTRQRRRLSPTSAVSLAVHDAGEDADADARDERRWPPCRAALRVCAAAGLRDGRRPPAPRTAAPWRRPVWRWYDARTGAGRYGFRHLVPGSPRPVPRRA